MAGLFCFSSRCESEAERHRYVGPSVLRALLHDLAQAATGSNDELGA